MMPFKEELLSTLTHLRLLRCSLQMLGRLADASTAFLGALKVYITVCGEEHLSTAATMHNLGLLHKQLVELEPDNPDKVSITSQTSVSAARWPHTWPSTYPYPAANGCTDDPCP